jgi:predicted O-linked N-acetylglucosamine transferase (SPINDLY family)
MGILGRLLSRSKGAASAGSDAAGSDAAGSDALIAEGQAHEDRGELDRAEAVFREAIARAPRYARAHMNLGNVLQKQGRLEEAAQAQRDALDCDPSHPGAQFNLGAVLLALGRLDDAQAAFARALELDPAFADAAVCLAECRSRAGDAAGARGCLERAVRLAPGHAGAHANLGLVALELGDIAAADAELARALEIDAGFAAALAGRARIEVMRGHAKRAEPWFRAALAAGGHDMEVWSAWLFSLGLRDDLDEAAVAREHFAFGARFDRAPARPARCGASGKVRVGYVSADFSAHPVALFLRPVLEHHDRDRFEVFCYSNGTDEDEVTAALRSRADRWRGIAGREDPWVEGLVREDGIDLLVDLSGHTAGNRLSLFARKPAAVQATWLGYLNTTGLAAVDYRICDPHTDPEGATEAFNREKLARLPHSQWCYAPYYPVALPAPRPADGAIRFASFNQFVKVSDGALDLWCAILRALPGSRLAIHGVPRGVTPEDVLPRLEARGIAPERVELVGRLAILEYFQAIARADIALDTWPYNGATTTLDTLWMGTPVVALRGERALSRGAYSIVTAAGLHELVARSPAEYVEKNVALARDAAARERLRGELRARLERSPVMDAAGFTRDLEALYRRMLGAAVGR